MTMIDDELFESMFADVPDSVTEIPVSFTVEMIISRDCVSVGKRHYSANVPNEIEPSKERVEALYQLVYSALHQACGHAVEAGPSGAFDAVAVSLN